MPSMSRFMLILLPLLTISLTAGALSGCKEDDEPRQVCARSHIVQGTRGPYYSCDEYVIACLKPLKLDQKDGKLICRLRDPGESE